MESPAENKRTAALALAVLGLLMVGAFVVLIFFNGDDDTSDDASGNPSATSAPPDGSSGGSAGGDGKPSDGTTSGAGAVKPILTQAEAAAAHQLMTDYMAGLSTYTHTDKNASWAEPLLALTANDPQLRQDTGLPTGKAWDTCVATKCASQGKATVVRDAMVASDLVRGSGKTLSSLVEVTAARSEDGRNTGTETNSWLVTARNSNGTWKVSSVSIFGLGNVGASDQAGG
ncbi:hypothetical protein Q5762_08575 [Streptomyces sp. P9(2023)]|uniref:hypothetical protein n=1 Tax=Streptomyces sp. P9(2023) TaxID=3064394 RepID=UPI0028F3E921|nr:hypothetical protein [Streptomyces sp. P9(2023)]MDT9688410.1 hypothetical protein [Streptomyces sp. P9(2023)]